MAWATSVAPTRPNPTKISQATYIRLVPTAPKGFPTEGKGGSCCNLAVDVMSAFCRGLGNSAPENVLTPPELAEEGLVFSNI